MWLPLWKSYNHNNKKPRAQIALGWRTALRLSESKLGAPFAWPKSSSFSGHGRHRRQHITCSDGSQSANNLGTEGKRWHNQLAISQPRFTHEPGVSSWGHFGQTHETLVNFNLSPVRVIASRWRGRWGGCSRHFGVWSKQLSTWAGNVWGQQDHRWLGSRTKNTHMVNAGAWRREQEVSWLPSLVHVKDRTP